MTYTKRELDEIVDEVLKRLGETKVLTDFNVGSVTRLLVESICREIYNLYAQLDKVYDSGFIDTTKGRALDEVVKILGVERDGLQSVKRKKSNPSSGWVIFGRSTRPTEEITIPKGTRVATVEEPIVEFATTQDSVLKTASDVLNKLNEKILDAIDEKKEQDEIELSSIENSLNTEEGYYAEITEQINTLQKEIQELSNSISKQNFEWIEDGINIGEVIAKKGRGEGLEASETYALEWWTCNNISLINKQGELTTKTGELEDKAAVINKRRNEIIELSKTIDDLTTKYNEVKAISQDLRGMLFELSDLVESKIIVESKRTSILNEVYEEVHPDLSEMLSNGKDAIAEATIDEFKEMGVWPWEVKAPIRAINPGLAGDVNPGEIGVIPVPIPGIDYVRNEEETSEGRDPETDDDLRERAKKALQVAARATATAIEYALRSLPGVNTVTVKDMPRDIPGEVQITVVGSNYDVDEIEKKVQQIKAVGVRAKLVLQEGGEGGEVTVIYTPSLETSS